MPPKVQYRGGARRPQSKRKIPRSKYAGVHWHSGARKWVAQISIKCVRTHLGYFESDDEAAKKYDAMARKLNDGRILNFPDEGAGLEEEEDLHEELDGVLERSKKRQKSSTSMLETLSDMAVLEPAGVAGGTKGALDPPTSGEEEEEEEEEEVQPMMPRKKCWGRYH